MAFKKWPTGVRKPVGTPGTGRGSRDGSPVPRPRHGNGRTTITNCNRDYPPPLSPGCIIRHTNIAHKGTKDKDAAFLGKPKEEKKKKIILSYRFFFLFRLAHTYTYDGGHLSVKNLPKLNTRVRFDICHRLGGYPDAALCISNKYADGPLLI